MSAQLRFLLSVTACLISCSLTSQNIGIGTTAPEELLHIKNGNLKVEDQFSVLFNGAAGDTTGLRFYTTDVLRGALLYDASAHTLNLSSNDTIAGLFYDFDTDKLFLGRDQGINVNEFFGVSFDTPAGGFGGMYLDAGGANGPVEGKPFYGYATNGTQRAYHYFDEADDTWKLNAGGDRMYVRRSNGYLGLNIANPLDRLHVGGHVRVESTIPTLSLYQSGVQGSFIQQNVDHLYVRNVENGNLFLGTNNTNQLAISASDITAFQDLKIDGIVRSLIFSSGASDRGKLELNGLNLGLGPVTPTGRLFFKTQDATRMIIDEEGQVGIGTTAPNRLLDVAGSVQFDSLGIGLGPDPILEKTHIKGAVRLDNIGIIAPKLNFYHDNNQVGLIQTTPANLQIANTHVAGNIDLFTDGIERLRVHNNGDFEFNDGELFLNGGNGRVGIGTTTPADDLHVMGGMIVERTDPIVALRESGSNVGLLYHINDDLLVSNLIAGDIEFRTDNLTRMTVSDDGNVGIGILNPSFKLEVGGAIRSYDANNPGMQLIQNGTWVAMLQMVADDLVIGCLQNDAITLRTNNISRMVIEPAGNVGVGVFDPEDVLHVGGTLRIDNAGTPQLRFHQGATFTAFMQTSGDDFMISNKLAGELRLMTNDLTRLEVQNDGDVLIDGSTLMVKAGTNQVAIGTSQTATGYKLNVDGKVIAEEMKVQLSQNWPDYVFEEDYPLMSLRDTKEFVQQYGHLPGVPSAKEVAQENGIHLGEMNRILLEKVEELTLHVISLQEEVDALKNQQQHSSQNHD